MTRILSFFAILALICLQAGINPPSIHAQQEQKTQQELQHEVSVVLKLIQVHVTDKKGNPITDLEPSDFVIYDNRKNQSITEFEIHLQPTISTTTEEALEETDVAPARDVAGQLNRKLFFVFDLARSTVQGLSKSKDTALHFLDTQALPTDEIGIVTFSQLNGLVIHEYLSGEHERVKKTISDLREIVGRTSDVGGMSLNQQGGQADASLGSSYSDQFARAVDPAAEFDTKKTYSFFAQMEDLAKSLRYIPGYKNIILFSNGFPNYLYGQASSTTVTTGDLMFREYHDAMTKEMSSSNSPVFTVNAEGRRAHIRDRDNRGDYSLKNMSQVSGGQYFENIDDHKGIAEQLQQATSNYYVLGYYIGENWDGEYHEVRVEVKRKGVKVRSQKGYFNPKPFHKFTKSEKLLHLLDLALNEEPQLQEPLPLPLLALNCSEAPDSNLAILTEIPRERLEEITQKKAEVVTMIFDEYNFIVDQIQEEFDMKKLSRDYRFHAYVASLIPGNYRCSVIVRNTETGRAAVGSTGIEIPEPLESGFKLYPPLFAVPEKVAIYYQFKRIKKAEGEQTALSPLYLSLKEHSPLVQVLEKDTEKIWAIVRSFSTGIPAPTVNLGFELLQEDSESSKTLSSSVLSSQWKEGVFIQTMEIELPDLASGIYTLKTFTQEDISGERFKHIQKLRIK